MNISLEQAAGILGKSTDEVMFLVQTNKLAAGVNPDTLSWAFVLEDVLSTKQQLDESVESDPQFLIE